MTSQRFGLAWLRAGGDCRRHLRSSFALARQLSAVVALLCGCMLAHAQPVTASPSAAGPGVLPATTSTPTIITNSQPGIAEASRTTGTNDSVPENRISRNNVVSPGNLPGEFQRFLTTVTGHSLAVFGAHYFSGTPQTFAPLDRVPVPQDYVLGPGDELYIRAWGNIDIDYRTTIDRNGHINIPRVGSIMVVGLKSGEVEGHLRGQIGRVFKGFSLNVTLGQLRSIQIFVVGQARQPGVYTVGSLSTLVNAVFASGGPGANGSMRQVQLRRGKGVVTELDLYDFIVRGDKSKDTQLQPGDVIVYLPAGPLVGILGAVDTQAVYELKPTGNNLGELMSLAGAGRAVSNQIAAHLERIDPTASKAPRRVISLDLARAAQTKLQDGDVVTVFALSPHISNAITLRGNVASPLRYPFSPGMRISHLIPEREALITSDYYLRKNRLVQFLEPLKSESLPKDVPAGMVADEVNWEYATVERLDVDSITTRLIPFHLGKAVLERDPANDLALQPGDVVTVFSSKDIRGPQARSSRLVRVEGEVDRPGLYQLQPGETLRALLRRAGGLTPHAYVYGLEFSREETRQRQRENLASAIARLETQASLQTARNAANRSGDAEIASTAAASAASTQAQMARLSRITPNGRIALELEPFADGVDSLPDIPLEHADRVSVPARPGFVTVAGAVVNSNAFLWKAGRTAGDYVKLAGLDEGAEVSGMFILRADGTVKHAIDSRSFFGIGGNLHSELLYPGDSVVVPNQLDFETWGRSLMRNLKDWSQILSQFGLGAAAIKTLSN